MLDGFEVGEDFLGGVSEDLTNFLAYDIETLSGRFCSNLTDMVRSAIKEARTLFANAPKLRALPSRALYRTRDWQRPGVQLSDETGTYRWPAK